MADHRVTRYRSWIKHEPLRQYRDVNSICLSSSYIHYFQKLDSITLSRITALLNSGFWLIRKVWIQFPWQRCSGQSQACINIINIIALALIRVNNMYLKTYNHRYDDVYGSWSSVKLQGKAVTWVWWWKMFIRVWRHCDVSTLSHGDSCFSHWYRTTWWILAQRSWRSSTILQTLKQKSEQEMTELHTATTSWRDSRERQALVCWGMCAEWFLRIILWCDLLSVPCLQLYFLPAISFDLLFGRKMHHHGFFLSCHIQILIKHAERHYEEK